jgi:putative oxidoreductase
MVSLFAFQEIATAYGIPVARVLLAAVFLYSGWDKLWHWREGVKEVVGLGLPWPAVFAAGTILVQLAGGVTIVSGFGAEFGAAILAVFTIVATLLGHRFWLLRGDAAKHEFITSLEHLAIVGGLILVIVETVRNSSGG